MTSFNIHKCFKFYSSGEAEKDSIVEFQNARFTVLTNRLIRMEYSKVNMFEDHPSQGFWYRKQPAVKFTKIIDGNKLEINTDSLHIIYIADGNEFSSKNLSVQLLNSNKIWKFGDVDEGNLKGTVRTLDRANGSVPLEDGLISKNGWTVYDDSKNLVFDESGWLKNRENEENQDFYFWGYDHNYLDCLRDYMKISGNSPMLPRWALGNWWSRYYKYSDKELLGLMEEFKQRDIPLSVCIVDIDWHIRENEYNKRGWTGYTWNKELFPEPQKFLDGIHEMGLKTALNLHPADGVDPHEEKYEEMAEFMGMDPSAKENIKFDIADSKFMMGYFDILHHPLEKSGVDFWWMDWQQGNTSNIKGLDPLWFLNHLHYLDLERDKDKRSIAFSRWSGLGNQRYPIDFSGDTYVSWESLAFQPYFTSTASNTACFWWSHDIGGHMGGVENGEMYARWIQFGAFSPILRLHSTNNLFQDRRPWAYDENVYNVSKKYMRLRHHLIPYLYSMTYLSSTDGMPLITPMYYHAPEKEEAYCCPQQYFFGTELVAAPFVSPIDSSTNYSHQVVWLSEGDWFNFFTGEYKYGNAFHSEFGTLEESPVFAKAGAIVPMSEEINFGDVSNPKEIKLVVFPGNDNKFVLYEDDGVSQSYKDANFVKTLIEEKWTDKELKLVVHKAEGNHEFIPEGRNYRLCFRGINHPENISVYLNDVEVDAASSYIKERSELNINSIEVSSSDELTIVLSGSNLLNNESRVLDKCKSMIKKFAVSNCVKAGLTEELSDIINDISLLAKFSVSLPKSCVEALIETINEEGYYNSTASGQEILVLWNNLNKPGVTYNYSESLWNDFNGERGVLPKFKWINPSGELDKWELKVNYLGLSEESIRKVNRDI